MRESITFVLDLVDEYTGPANAVLETAGNLDDGMKELHDEMKRAGTIKADLAHFNTLKQRVSATSDSLQDAKLQTTSLGREIANTENPTKKQLAAFAAAKKQVEKLTQSESKYRSEMKALELQLRKTGVNTNRLDIEQRKAEVTIKKNTRALDTHLKSLEKQAKLQAKISGYETKAANYSVGAGDVVAAGGGAYTINALAQEAGRIASAQGTLQSLGTSQGDINEITDMARNFSSEYAGFSQEELIANSYDIKSALSDQSGAVIAEYTKISALVAGGTKADIETMTKLISSGYGVYRSSFDSFGAAYIEGWENLTKQERDLKFGETFGAGIAATVQQFKTDGQQMSDAIKALGKVAVTSGVEISEQLAILGEFQTSGGLSGSEAATKYKSFLNTAVKGGEKLGLTFTDVNGQLYSSMDIIDKLKGKYGETLSDIEKKEIKDAFGSDEALAAITLMWDSVDSLRKGSDSIRDSMLKGKSVYQDMANAIMKGGPQESMELLGQITRNTAADLGYSFAPVVMQVAQTFGSISLAFGQFLRENELAGKIIAYTVTGLVALKVATVASQFAMGGYYTTMALVSKGLLLWSQRSAIATAATAVMGNATAAFNAVLMANPIGMVIAGVVALGAAAYMLYKHWDMVCAGLKTAWDTVTGWLSGALDVFISMVTKPFEMLKEAFDWVTGWFDEDVDKKVTVDRVLNDTKASANLSAQDREVGARMVQNQHDKKYQYGNYQLADTGSSLGGTTSNNLSNYQVTSSNAKKEIHQQNDYKIVIEGSDLPPQDIAREVRAEMERHERERERRARQALYD